jgi:hypothetical protein
MTTTALHTNLQRSRFAQHALAAFAKLVPLALRLPLKAIQPSRAPDAGESASIEAQKVRQMAHTYAKTDPGFAADLYAAAARHEAKYEG